MTVYYVMLSAPYEPCKYLCLCLSLEIYVNSILILSEVKHGAVKAGNSDPSTSHILKPSRECTAQSNSSN